MHVASAIRPSVSRVRASAAAYALLMIMVMGASIAQAQAINWTDVSSSYSLPAGVKIFAGTRPSPALSAWYIDVDMTNPAIAVRPYLTSSTANVATLNARFGAIASVNGGVFSGSTSLATVVYPFDVRAQNVAAVTRNAMSYPVIRSFFGVDKNRQMHVNWIYHFDATLGGIRTFAAPLPDTYNDPTPEPTPQAAQGSAYPDLLLGIGGAPTLVKGSAVHVTLNEEIIWGSGIAEDTSAADPRTAIGYTAAGHCIMLAADGRNINGSVGLGLGELARVMISLGCVEAMNLDGGGSTQIAVGSQTLNGQSSRAVPSIFSVIVADSLNLPATPTFEKIIDSGDSSCSINGGGWFESANSGWYGATKSLLHTTGDGTATAVFRPNLPTATTYQLFGWWVAASNRCTNTPFIVYHAGTIDTVRLNQTANGQQWSAIGTYFFAGGAADSIVISNQSANAGQYVVADAIRLISYDAGFTGVHEVDAAVPATFHLAQNFPNPFNPSTVIRYSLATRGQVLLEVFDVLGRRVAVLVDAMQPAGWHEVRFDGSGLSSGTYLCSLRAGGYTESRKLILMR